MSSIDRVDKESYELKLEARKLIHQRHISGLEQSIKRAESELSRILGHKNIPPEQLTPLLQAAKQILDRKQELEIYKQNIKLFWNIEL